MSTGFLVPLRVQVFPIENGRRYRTWYSHIGSLVNPVSSSLARGRQAHLPLSPHWLVITSLHYTEIKELHSPSAPVSSISKFERLYLRDELPKHQTGSKVRLAH